MIHLSSYHNAQRKPVCYDPQPPTFRNLPTIRRINHTIINIPINVIPPITRERDGLATRAKEHKRHNENHNLSTTIQSRTEDVIKLQKPFGLVAAQVVLGPEGDDEEGDDGGVDARDEPPDVPADDGHVEVIEAGLWEEAMQDVAWQGREEADYEAEGHPLVGGAPRIHLFGETAPGDGLGVEGLEGLDCVNLRRMRYFKR